MLLSFCSLLTLLICDAKYKWTTICCAQHFVALNVTVSLGSFCTRLTSITLWKRWEGEEKGQENSIKTWFTRRLPPHWYPSIILFVHHTVKEAPVQAPTRDSTLHENLWMCYLLLQYSRRLQWGRKLWIYLWCLGSAWCRRSLCVGWSPGQWSHSCTHHPSEIRQHDGDAQELSTGLKIQITVGKKVNGYKRKVIEKVDPSQKRPLAIFNLLFSYQTWSSLVLFISSFSSYLDKLTSMELDKTMMW